MKFSFAIGALLGNVLAQGGGGGGGGGGDGPPAPPAEAIGECADSSECAAQYCVFTVIPGGDGPESDTWEPSFCGSEEDCKAGRSGGDEGAVGQGGGEGGPSGPKTFCFEFGRKEGEGGADGEDSSIKLYAATMTASILALALSI